LITIKEWYKDLGVDNKWSDMLNICYRYEQLKKVAIVHKDIYENCNIGYWITTQKGFLKECHNDKNMNQKKLDRIEKLSRLTTIQEWKTNPTNDEKWMDKYELCMDYETSGENKIIKKIVHGTKHKGNNIGNWMGSQKGMVTSGDGKRNVSRERFILLLNCHTFNEWYKLNYDKSSSQYQKFYIEICQQNIINKPF
jgi:hypothetical protein